MLFCNDYSFYKERQCPKSSQWKCAMGSRLRCKARAIVSIKNNVEVVRLTYSDHNHSAKYPKYMQLENKKKERPQ